MSKLQSFRQLGDSEIVGRMLGDLSHTADTPEGRRALALRKLLGDLMALNIRPLLDEDVDGYQLQKVNHDAKIAFIGRLLSVPRGGDFLPPKDEPGKRVELALRYAIPAIAFAATLAVAGAMTPVELRVQMSLVVGGLILGLVVAFCLDVIGSHLWARNYDSRWLTSDLNYFVRGMEQHVPHDVLQLAARVRGARPDTMLFVEHFKKDPFLTVQHPTFTDIRFRIAVWDEHGFRTTDR